MLIAITTFSCDAINDSGVRYVNTRDYQIPTNAYGYTNEQHNILKRNKIVQDPTIIMWIYCLADNGQVVYYGPVDGKVTSSNKSIRMFNSTDDVGDGTTGGSDSYVFWFSPEGEYYQWNKAYFLSTAEIKISNTVLNFRRVE